jgi:UV DNA damage repair endonuclease
MLDDTFDRLIVKLIMRHKDVLDIGVHRVMYITSFIEYLINKLVKLMKISSSKLPFLLERLC